MEGKDSKSTSYSFDSQALNGDYDIARQKVVAKIDFGDVDQMKKSSLTPKKMFMMICILLTNMCERLSYYSVIANIVLYGTSVMKFKSSEAADVANSFSGVVFLMPVIGGLVSDSWVGKFKTILASGFLYILGLVLLPLSAFNYKSLFGESDDGSYYDISLDARRSLFFASLAVIAMGTGGIKANIGPFGAQQLQQEGEAAIKSFFNWFYWFINVGSLAAYTGVAYLQQNISFGWGFVVPLVSMIVGLVVFVIARPFYVQEEPEGSVLQKSAQVIWQVMTRRKVKVAAGQKSRIFDRARLKYGGSFDDEMVESVRAVLRILPVFLTIILYWAINSQMQTTFLFQGERMDVNVRGFKIPASSLNSFNTFFVILLIPIVDRLFYPCMEKIGRPLSHLQRIGIGFLLTILFVVVAGIIEIARKNRMEEEGGILLQELGGETFKASAISVFVQVPLYALVGASEVFASICGNEFAYTQAPKSMQGLLTGLFYATNGLGDFLATGILNAVEGATKDYPWFADEMNDAHVEYYFFLLAVLMFIDFLVFLVVARFYRYRKYNYDDMMDHKPANTNDVLFENTHL